MGKIQEGFIFMLSIFLYSNFLLFKVSRNSPFLPPRNLSVSNFILGFLSFHSFIQTLLKIYVNLAGTMQN